jgi:hypothetical protein
MENGSGGFVSDLTFRGGSIGWRAAELAELGLSLSHVFAFAHLFFLVVLCSQQYTVINLKFGNCLTAV